MALPAALPWLAAAFLEVIKWFIGVFGAQASYRMTLAFAGTAAFLAITTTLILALKALVEAISMTLPAWLEAGRFLVPENLAVCFGIMFSAKIARWVYDFSYRQINIFLKP